MSMFHRGNLRFQQRFDTRRIAERIEERLVGDTISGHDKAFIERLDMFFLATADEDGRQNCSYKGGDPGFVSVLDDHPVAFPNYDGNGMFLSMGNIDRNPNVGMLFIAFGTGHRLRLNGQASIDESDPLMVSYPEAQFIVRVRAREVSQLSPVHSPLSAREAIEVRTARGIKDTGT